MKESKEIKKILSKIIVEELGIQEKLVDIEDDIRLIEDLELDSVQLMNLIIHIEEKFEIDFTDSKILFENYNRIGDLTSMISEMISEERRG